MNKAALKQYIKLVEFLGKILGPDYEIVLHDLTDEKYSIIAIANGHITGRSIGEPLTNLGLKIMALGSYKDNDYFINYNGASKENGALRSSTMFIKDDTEEIIGLLCINFDDSKYVAISEEILKLCHPDNLIVKNKSHNSFNAPLPDVSENFSESIEEATQAVLKEFLKDKNIPANRLTQNERLHIVDILNENGIFMLKGAVNEVAKQLHCSEPSIYRYLNILSKDKN